ncbi:MAG: discoidin domain-containing protein [Rikenellaceae bacterium]
MKKILSIFSIAILLFSCSKDNLDTTTQIMQSSNSQADYRISVSIDTETKVAINDGQLSWNSDEQIYVTQVITDSNGYESLGDVMAFIIDESTISEDGKSAEFIGEELVEGENYFAFSSEEFECNEDGVITYINTITIQSEDNNTQHIGDSWIMSSNIFTATSEGVAIQFYNEQSIISLDIMMSEDITTTYEVLIVRFEAENTIFATTLNLKTTSEDFIEDSVESVEVLFENAPVISSTQSCTVNIPVVIASQELNEDSYFTVIVMTNMGEFTHQIPARALENGKLYYKDIILTHSDDITESVSIDRDILMELYYATDGDNWYNNDNWGSSADLGDWDGIDTDDEGNVIEIYLPESNLTGEIPNMIGDLEHLQYINLSGNHISGPIPDAIGNLSNLQQLHLYSNELTGEIPWSISTLSNLTHLQLYNNQLSGSIPESIGNLTTLKRLYLENNLLTGVVPESIINLSSLEGYSFVNNNLSGSISLNIQSWNLYSYSCFSPQNEGFGLVEEAEGEQSKEIDSNSVTLLDRANWIVSTSATESSEGADYYVIDGSFGTYWHSPWSDGSAATDGSHITIDMGTTNSLYCVVMLPRSAHQYNTGGIYTSSDGVNFTFAREYACAAEYNWNYFYFDELIDAQYFMFTCENNYGQVDEIHAYTASYK